MNFCRDCHFCPTATPDTDTRCQHPIAVMNSALHSVTGDDSDLDIPVKRWTCVAMRQYGYCASGIYWQARE